MNGAGTYTNLDLVMNLISGFQTVEPRWNGLKLYLCVAIWLLITVSKVRRGGDENVVRYAAPAEEEEEMEVEENQPLSEVACQLDNLNSQFLFFIFFWCLNIFLPGGLPAWPAGGGVGRMQAGAGIQIKTYKSRYTHSKNTNTKIQKFILNS